mmetsp:Transcript_52491/g.94110  ORF Transcript_52491/g.94110 Transcript_52491/m.94110 type:complete len:648 (+) Transcript_52491:51-1994(+)
MESVAAAAVAAESCWLPDHFSNYFFCCSGPAHWKEERDRFSDCWGIGLAHGSKAACCKHDGINRLEAKVAALSQSSDGPAPCAGASSEILRFLEGSAERILFQGRPFGTSEDELIEEGLIQDASTVYEVCAPALLLALAARVTRLRAYSRKLGGDMGGELAGSSADWKKLFDVWDNLVWTEPLAWANLRDPGVRLTLQAVVNQMQMIQALAARPADACIKFQNNFAALLLEAEGLSLTTSKVSGQNIGSYPSLSTFALVLASHGDLVSTERDCNEARVLAHYFNTRRFLDLRPDLGDWHFMEAMKMEFEAVSQLPRHTDGVRVIFPGIWQLVQKLELGLQQHLEWWQGNQLVSVQDTLTLPSWTLGDMKVLGPMSIWHSSITSVFSAAFNDAVIERIMAMIGVRNRFFVEIGTQAGDQCNSRNLRVRHGFRGLMMDMDFENDFINLRRHHVTPDNVVSLLRSYEVPAEFDFLSLDTDGNQWLLWMQAHYAGYRPRIVMLEFGIDLPYDEDVAVRYSAHHQVHQLCLTNLGRMPWLSSASITSLLRLGNSLGYSLVHLGGVDLTFLRRDLLEESQLRFPAQDDAAGLCALADYQAKGRSGLQNSCPRLWPMGRERPPQDLLTTASAALAGDFRLPESLARDFILKTYC